MLIYFMLMKNHFNMMIILLLELLVKKKCKYFFRETLNEYCSNLEKKNKKIKALKEIKNKLQIIN